MKKAIIIVNPSSGKEEALIYKEKIETILHNQGYDVVVSMTEKELDATRFCQDACDNEFELVVSMGGDGTLHETINGLVGQDHLPTLGIIPMGTVNDFARALKIPLDPKQAIELLKKGETRRVDVGSLNERYFVNIVAIGAIAEATYDVTPEQKTKLGALAYVVESVKTLVAKENYHLKIEHDHGKWEGKAFLFLAALTNSTGGFEKLSPHAQVDDGVMHCYIIKGIGWLRMASIGASILKGELREDDDVIYFTTKKVSISSQQSLITNVDGEEGDTLPVSLEVLRKHIEVIVPLN